MSKDMTEAQFLAALERNGFCKPMMCWVQSKDSERFAYGMVFSVNGGLRRRETLAKIIRERARDRAKAEAAS